MSQPLVSVIIPTYNRETYLLKAIESVATQDYSAIEILVIDDGSKLNYAEEICNKFKNCTYYFKENGGLSSARNFGIDKSRGEYVAFLDDDDFFHPSKIKKQVQVLIDHDEVMLVHSSALIVDENGEETGKTIGASKGKERQRSGHVFWNALGVWVVKSPTPLIRKSAFSESLKFDESIRVGEDIDFYQRFFYRNKVFYIPEPLAYYRVYSDKKRLSLQRQQYIGIEQKMLVNFKKMGVSSSFTLAKIARKLIKQAIVNWNMGFPDAPKKLQVLKYYCIPMRYIKNDFLAE